MPYKDPVKQRAFKAKWAIKNYNYNQQHLKYLELEVARLTKMVEKLTNV